MGGKQNDFINLQCSMYWHLKWKGRSFWLNLVTALNSEHKRVVHNWKKVILKSHLNSYAISIGIYDFTNNFPKCFDKTMDYISWNLLVIKIKLQLQTEFEPIVR